MLKLATKCAPTAEALDKAYRAGFRQVELFLDTRILADADDALAQARDFPHEYVLHFPNRLDRDPALLDAVVALYRGLACRCMVIHKPLLDKFGTELLARDPGLTLAVENHKLTPEAFQGWAVEHAGLTLDVEHLWKFTLDDGPLDALLTAMRRFLADHATRLRHVHLPGYWPGHVEHRPMYCSRELVWPILSLLADADFRGLIVSEIRTEDQTDFDLRMDALLFDRWRSLRREDARENAHGA